MESKFKIIKGRLNPIPLEEWYFPAEDIGTMDWYFRGWGIIDVEGVIDMIKPHMKQYRRVIQAGGAVGIWPLRLAQVFKNVTTFEPEPVNRECLLRNIQGFENIQVTPFALGERSDIKVKMALEPKKKGHCGAYYVQPGGTIQMIRIDDLNYNDVDLIFLDIEGSERNAISGAVETIKRCKPIIGIEEKGFHRRFNGGKTPHQLLQQLGYRPIGKPNRDDILFIHDPTAS